MFNFIFKYKTGLQIWILEIEELKLSLSELKIDSKPQWGKMTSAQMLKHCNRQAKLYCNEYSSNLYAKFLANTIGKFHLFYVKYYLKYDIYRYKKNSFSLKFLDTTNLFDIDFEEEKNILIKRLNLVSNYKKKFIVNPMHGLVSNETFKKNIFAHVKYHLNQFGVLKKIHQTWF